MRSNVYSKNIIRTITGSLGRFLSILAIIALGVGFFSGVKVTKDSMIITCDKYVSEYNMYDFRLVSTLGFNDEEIKKLEGVKGISAAEGSITKDIYSLDAKSNRVVYRVHSITDSVNRLKLSEGRMPEAANECVGDMNHFTSDEIGREIKVIEKNDKDTKDSFRYKKMKLVGLVSSTVYINRTERGTAAIGDGQIDSYIYVPEDAFTDEYYTEAYMTCEKQGYAYSEEYDRNIKALKPDVKSTGEQCGKDRYNEILADARSRINEAKNELEKGRRELEDKKAETFNKLENGKKRLDAEKKRLAKAENRLSQAGKLLNEKKTQLNESIGELEQKRSYAENNLANAQLALEQAQASGDESAIEEAAKAAAAAKGACESLNKGIEQAKNGLEQVERKIAELPAKEKQIRKGKAAISRGYKEYEEGLSKAKKEFARAEAEVADGEKEIKEEEEKLKDIEKPELYIQTRKDNTGYVSYDSNSDIVNSIAKVFPVFFFLIAALVCSTTMTRMIEEERGQIGVLRAMGYSRGKIMRKYMIYSGLAAIIGCILGFFLGSKFFPLAIFTAYGMMYDFAPLEFYFSLPLALVSVAVSLLCSAGTTYLACRGQLKEMPAQILLPKAPKPGKRVFLERIKPLWRKLSFSYKVSVRNVFRYKKRMIMMIAGISGCTALVLAGFGIYDSVGGLTENQFDEIEKYDMTVAWEKTIDDKTSDDFRQEAADFLEDFAVLEQIAVNAKSPKKIRSCSMIITGDGDRLTKLIDFRENNSDAEKIPYPGFGECVINNKLAELMEIEEGDDINVEYDDTKTVKLKVSGIYKNYVSNFIYITPETYSKTMNHDFNPTIMYVSIKDGINVRKAAEQISEVNGVAGMVINLDTREHVDRMMKSLDYVVWLVIACAGALAFIVLFNLTNINITERVREIATIKVLGFRSGETGAYVLRENMMLVVMGIAIGLPLGILLHKFIMGQIIVDAVAFNTTLKPLSYVYTVIAVIIFTLVVDIIMRKKLSRINMAESLKSVE